MHPLRIHTHSLLPWDEQYTPFIHPARFLPLARLVTGDLPIMDSVALLALLDRWRLGTHMFHLSCARPQWHFRTLLWSWVCPLMTPLFVDRWLQLGGGIASVRPSSFNHLMLSLTTRTRSYLASTLVGLQLTSTLSHSCRLSFLWWEREHHLLVGTPNPLAGVRCDWQVQLGVCYARLAVLCAMRRLVGGILTLKQAMSCKPSERRRRHCTHMGCDLW
jgi:hypothetical protein